MTETEKMLAGVLYDPSADGLPTLRAKAHTLCQRYNGIPETDGTERERILSELLPNLGKNVYLQGPIQFDYGRFTTIGDGSFANFNFTVLDCAPVQIGKNVFFGPNVSIYTPVHPLRWQERNCYMKEDGTVTDAEYARPVTIGDNCWIAGGVTICGGITIGSGTVIGAGSVVTRDIPAGVFAVGNPCHALRPITDEDRMPG